MRFSSRCVALDCMPVTPSISGSMTSSTLSGAPLRLALEKRSFAAFRSAASNGTGVGGGGGAAAVGGVCAGAPVWASAVTPERPVQRTQRINPREPRAIFIDRDLQIIRALTITTTFDSVKVIYLTDKRSCRSKDGEHADAWREKCTRKQCEYTTKVLRQQVRLAHAN